MIKPTKVFFLITIISVLLLSLVKNSFSDSNLIKTNKTKNTKVEKVTKVIVDYELDEFIPRSISLHYDTDSDGISDFIEVHSLLAMYEIIEPSPGLMEVSGSGGSITLVSTAKFFSELSKYDDYYLDSNRADNIQSRERYGETVTITCPFLFVYAKPVLLKIKKEDAVNADGWELIEKTYPFPQSKSQ